MNQVIPCLRALTNCRLEICTDDCAVRPIISRNVDYLTSEEFATKQARLKRGEELDDKNIKKIAVLFEKLRESGIRCAKERDR